MTFTVSQIAEIISASIEGNPNITIHTICKIEEGVEGGLSFLANPKYTDFVYETKASAVMVSKDFVPEKPVQTTLIRTENPYLALAKLLEVYQQMKPEKSGIAPQACVAKTATIGENVYIGEFVSVGENANIEDNVQLYPHVCVGDNVKIGKNTILYSGVKVYADCEIGHNTIIHAGAVIGADGFGFAQQEGNYFKVPQVGNVIIGNYVEIGANTCIDRATLGATKIHDHVKLDNLIQIAHNCEIGEGSAFASQSGVSGSTKIGKKAIVAGQVGITGHLKIGDNVVIGAQSGVINHVPDNRIVLGTPAISALEEKKLIIYRKKLPELFNQINVLEKQMKKSE
ncbi:MAG: UDP-3-O-(3-hydroxymyristoyl)glucosamine N-acyltransferase [Bacteroidetes bacterium]|nr:UDP-3-O-(3-hydroxymyristoyl)glucosamine N-acyltransferase [Bacteroidota bacterium]MCL1969108.1 UDP-3-O-(3-hydroxymyristoyl)glucosamine N-acyltransferase [Bacteroidota bacterium]